MMDAISKLNIFQPIISTDQETQTTEEQTLSQITNTGVAEIPDGFEILQAPNIDLSPIVIPLTTPNSNGLQGPSQQETLDASTIFEVLNSETNNQSTLRNQSGSTSDPFVTIEIDNVPPQFSPESPPNAAGMEMHIIETPLAAAGAERPMLSPEEIAVAQMQNVFKKQFQEFASDPEKFHATMKFIYGLEYDSPNNERWPLPASYSPEIAESLRQRVLAGDYSWLPKVEFIDDPKGANGWFLETPPPTILLNERLLNNPAEATGCFIKAIGYHLDNLTNDPDYDVDKEKEKYLGKEYSRAFWPVYPEELIEAPGNEGEKFRATLAHEFPREDIFHQEYRYQEKDSKNRVVRSFIRL